ncbi:MAG: chloride channel protein [Verrucomicrobia bacterium]|nr:chloride channel protein [Verrucomicrobiota bacterium]
MAKNASLQPVRRLFVRFRDSLPVDLRAYLLPVTYGLGGGLSAVAFQAGIQALYQTLWTPPSQLPAARFALVSLLTITASTLAAGLILTRISREAAGSGIPQVKAAFWRDFGFIRARVMIAKFFGGVITIGGGSSLGREGPSVHIAATVASTLAGLFGVAKQARRPALLSGAAAGLTAAFNTPLSAITFVFEEIVEDLNSTRFFAQVLIAAVTAAFVTHWLLGNVPAFDIPTISRLTWPAFFLVIPATALAALAGCIFQRATLSWRSQVKSLHQIPEFLRPAIGGLINWALGVTTFLLVARIGVFGLGYNDLEAMLRGEVRLRTDLILLVTKLGATIAVYAWGGAGGIFSPTLFFGAAAGLAVAEVGSGFLPLNASDRLALTVAGMSACLGAVVRAPLTSIVIVFEMTHQFTFVPILMLGTLVSQAVSRTLCHTNFYSEVLERDGIDLDKHIPPRSLAALQNRPVASIANFSPVYAVSLDRAAVAKLFAAVPYRHVPLVLDGKVAGVISRNEVLNTEHPTVRREPAICVAPSATIREAVQQMVNESQELVLLTDVPDGKLLGIVTLHDVLRFQNQFSEGS